MEPHSQTTGEGIIITRYYCNLVFSCMYMQVPNYTALCERYSYIADENVLSAVHEGLDLKLSSENYVKKFHKLVFLDEMVHCQKMAAL